MDANSAHLGDDLGSAARECSPHVGADAGDFGDAVTVDIVKHKPESGHEFSPERGLEDGFGGVALSVEGTSVEGGASAVGSFGDIEDGPVEVDAWVAEAAGSVHEHGAEEALTRLGCRATEAAADEAGIGFEVPLYLASGGVERFFYLAGVGLRAECPYQGHGLRR